MSDIEVTDNSDEVLRLLQAAKARALEKIGLTAEGYAVKMCPVDSGRLKNSITHTVDGDDAYICTNVEYAVYVELGSGKHYPGGRQTPWVYQDDKGNWHRTEGQEAQPFLKPAATEHSGTYRKIMEDELKNA